MRYLLSGFFAALLCSLPALAQSDGGCADGGTSCNGTCTNTNTDPSNCGACGLSCSTQLNQACVAGTCGCAYGEILPSTQCIGTGSDAGIVLNSPNSLGTILYIHMLPYGASSVQVSLAATATSSTGALAPTTIVVNLIYPQNTFGSLTIGTLYQQLVTAWHSAAGF